MKYLIFLVLLGIANAYIVNMNEAQDQLQAIQGLFVKPSSDGVTRDLYMAATEDNGAQSSWVADHPINFLTSPNLQPASSLPVTFSAGTTPATTHDNTAGQQRSVGNYPANYAYGAMPMSSHGFSSYAYAIPSFATSAFSHTNTENHTNKQSSEGGTAIAIQPQSQYTPMPFFYPGTMSNASSVYNSLNDGVSKENAANTAVHSQSRYTPMPFFYPGIISAAATAYNTLKDGASKDEPLGQIGVNHEPMWSPTAYPYPAVQYVMVDPSAWAASQAGAMGVVYGTTAGGPYITEVQNE